MTIVAPVVDVVVVAEQPDVQMKTTSSSFSSDDVDELIFPLNDLDLYDNEDDIEEDDDEEEEKGQQPSSISRSNNGDDGIIIITKHNNHRKRKAVSTE